MTATPDIAGLVRQDEGQYYERKSLWEGPAGAKRTRDRRNVRDQIAEYVAAFANADGGTLLLGVEDNGTITGHGYPPQAVDDMLAVPERRLRPPLAHGVRVTSGEHELLLFEVRPSPTPVMVVGNGFPYRVNDQTPKMREEEVAAIKRQGLIESAEARVSALTLGDLDGELIGRAAAGAGLAADEPTEYLLRRRLADWRGDHLVLREGAVLLFARDPLQTENPEAPVVRRFRVRGTKRLHGARSNVEELPSLEANLPGLVEQTYAWLSQQIRRSQRLYDLFFREAPEYPTFAWQEAVVNAVAHRDYRVSSNCIEIWLFDDRLEVLSPGGLVEPVTVQALTTRQRIHASRNPRINRVLSDLGLMRRQGEGIPRMIEAMEESWLPLPEFAAQPFQFQVTLRNTPVFEGADPAWATAVQGMDLTVRQKRVLVCYPDGEFSNEDYRRINQVDRDQAYRELRELANRGLVQSNDGKGRAARYRVVQTAPQGEREVVPPSVAALQARMAAAGRITNADMREVFGLTRHQATTALTHLVEQRVLVSAGLRGKGADYTAGPAWAELPSIAGQLGRNEG